MIVTSENGVKVSGRLTLEATTALFKQGLPMEQNKEALVVDMAAVEAVDSSAVSLMLSWLRAAQRQQVKLEFINVPDNLRSLANLYDVADSLALSA